MSVNFCHPAFQPDIRCDRVCVDGYEVTNLVSGGSGQNSPFLTESFIKPPVNVTIRFPCNVDVARIVFNSAHGAQRSCGFEIYSYCGKRRTSWLLDDVYMEPADDSELKIFSPIGRGTDEDASVFCFVNKRYRERYGDGHRMSSRLQPSSTFSEFSLAHHYQKHTSSVSDLTLRITRVAGSGVCAIRWLEIWGQPAYCCPAEVVAKIQALRAGLFTPPPVVKSTQPAVSENRTKDATSDIPPEFVDPITQELMSVPVLLPSGNSVDQSTVDRHIEEEAKWGRAPSDLFTGVSFSATCKPVPNASLKMRIDKFLLSGLAEGIQVTRRRLGGDLAGTRHAASRLVDTDRRQVNGTPQADIDNEAPTTSNTFVTGGRKNAAFISGSTGNGRRTGRCEYIEDVKCMTPCEFNRAVLPSAGDGPRRKRTRRSSTGGDIVTIDLTSDNVESQRVTETKLSRRESESGGTRNRVRTHSQQGEGRKRTFIDAVRRGSSDSSTFADVARQPSFRSVTVRGEAGVFRTTKTKDKLSTHVQPRTTPSRLGTSGTHKSISYHRDGSVGPFPSVVRIKATTEHQNARPGTTAGRQKASHEQDVDTSLEAALTSALSGLPTFSRRDRVAADKAKDSGCCACGEEVKGTVFYRLECAHVICRHCLLSSAPSGGAVVCGICRRETPSSGVLRIH